MHRAALRLFRVAAIAVAALCAAPASAFDWAGRIELDAEGLSSSSADDRLKAVQRLGTYEDSIGLTRPHLMRALNDADLRVRRAAGRVLAQHKVTEATPIVIGWLADPDRQTREVAADILGEIADPRALDPLIRSLGDPESEVRLRAIIAIGHYRDRKVVVALVGRLEDDKSTVRKAAVEQLAELGDKRAVIPLVGVFRDSALPVRLAAVRAIGKLGDRAAVPALLRLLRDPAEGVRVAAVSALGNLEAIEATDVLIDKLATGGEDFRTRAAYSLGQIAKSTAAAGASAKPADKRAANLAVRALVKALANPRLRAAGREALRNAGSVAVPALVSHLSGEIPGHPATAVALLRDIGDKSATPALVSELERGRVSQNLVLEAIAKSADSRALIPVLSLLSDEDAEVRLAAMRALEPMLGNDARAGDIILDRLRDTNDDISVLAARYLGRMKAKVAVPELLEIAKQSDRAKLRAAAVDALGRIGDARASEALLALLTNGPDELRLAAANGLIYIGDKSTTEPLMKLARDRSLGTRVAVVRALGGVLRDTPHAGAREFLVGLAREGRVDVSLAAIASLSAMADPDSKGALLELAAGADPNRKRAAIEALGNLSDKSLGDKLAPQLRDRDDRVAQAAALALGKLGAGDHSAALATAARRRGFATPINASAALALLARPADADKLAGLIHHKSRLVRSNAAIGLGKIAHEKSRRELEFLLERDPSWLVRLSAGRALSMLGKADKVLAKAAKNDAKSENKKAFEALVKDKFVPAKRTDWRNFYFVDPVRGDAPVKQEPYFVIGSDGIATALYTDERGEAAEEKFPPGEHMISSAVAETEY